MGALYLESREKELPLVRLEIFFRWGNWYTFFHGTKADL
jgi:hypothetical protein